MAPQPLKVGTSKQSKMARSAPKTAEKPKKRAVEQISEESDEEFGDQGSGIDMSDDEEEVDGDDEEDDDEAFPEFDSELEDIGQEEASDEEQGEQDTSDETEIVEDSDSESGYNTSDIERMYASDDDPQSEGDKGLSVDEKLSRLIAKNTVKPDDSIGTDDKISRAKEGVGRLVPSKHVKGSFVREYDEYEAGYGSESSTEDNPNTVGNIPMEWYDDLPHIGYDVNGRKIFRPLQGDELDKFLANVEDPSAWTSAEDKLLQQNVQLSDKELDIIRRLERAENPDADFDPYQPTIEWFTGEGKERVMPLSAAPEPKRRFVPSKWEHKKIMKIVKAIREGRIIPNKPSAEKPRFYPIWSDADQHNPHVMYMPAPQLPPPKTAESYNPPEEYLPTEEEKAEWEAMDKEDRKTDFLPGKYDALRKVPGYKNLVQEKFERCLDLYLAPRTRRVKLNIDPESLIPKLPAPKELRPFPIASTVQYRHPGDTRVRSVSTSPDGQWIASGSEDGVVRVWDLGNGREVWRWDLHAGPVQYVEWSPSHEESLLVALVAGKIAVLSPLALVAPHIAAQTLTHSNTAFATSSATTKQGAGTEVKGIESVKWTRPSEKERERGVLVYVEVPGTPKQVTWHRKGDYFATVASDAANKSVLIHQLSRHGSQSPFRKTPGTIQRIAFHPSKPHFFAATQRYIRLYDLAAQKLIRTLQSGVKWISSMDVHPGGDNLIIGSYDKKLAWFDMDLSAKPYKTLRYHNRALRSVAYHPTLPLFASASDDGTVHIFHCTVYTDLMQNPLIVPLKILRGHKVIDGIGVLDLRWVPGKPWLVSSGADGEVRLWCS
ncbi:ribosome biogenesis protein ERB1 [Cryptococcus neoformans]|nr:ribosome biogenesis protein ERB1 [Cryptococcus neoformans var. grubii Bt1]OXG31677.1 ribosome biogenesis protein ERB1 [Cryptococcus neoformans var. grubii Ze90-1]OXH40170.1 ribosome biogenesis protein ERB1 [Cryptococcus neoformans var. grubii]